MYTSGSTRGSSVPTGHPPRRAAEQFDFELCSLLAHMGDSGKDAGRGEPQRELVRVVENDRVIDAHFPACDMCGRGAATLASTLHVYHGAPDSALGALRTERSGAPERQTAPWFHHIRLQTPARCIRSSNSRSRWAR